MNFYSFDCTVCGLSDKAKTWESLEHEMQLHAAEDHWDKKDVIYISANAQGSMGFIVEREPLQNPMLIEKLAAFDRMIEEIK